MKRDEVDRLVRGEHHEPHRLLGAHIEDGKAVVRAFRPDATEVAALLGREGSAERVKLDQVHPAGLFEGRLGGTTLPTYRLEVTYPSGGFTIEDPYRFWPTIGDLDQYLLGEGRHERLWQRL
ncbi:MAG TPA: 1,4-alpha-glucan branching enzyme, partial [Actinomycetes bacterium]|nr:1,4-alpha-glucan branching enzyme [Actinomycetes bacterium]